MSTEWGCMGGRSLNGVVYAAVKMESPQRALSRADSVPQLGTESIKQQLGGSSDQFNQLLILNISTASY